MNEITKSQQQLFDSFNPDDYEASTQASPIMALLRERYTLGRWVRDCPGKRVLDIGCGHGETALAVAPVARTVVSMDLSFPFVVATRRNLRERKTIDLPGVQGDGMILPFRSGSFDVVISHGGIHHIPDQAAAIREIGRILKPGGIFLAFEPNRNRIFTFLDFYAQLFFNNPNTLKPLQERLQGDSYRERMRHEAELHPALLSYEEYEAACRSAHMEWSCEKFLHPILPLRLLRLDRFDWAWKAMFHASRFLTWSRFPTLRNKEGFLIIRAKKLGR
jgi:ubiquinone/menaquinone biosynthesis C-methylase UbiE